MHKVLIAFLGKVQYDETTYQIGDKLYNKQRLVFIPIYEHFSPFHTVYIIGTKDSKWEMLKDFSHERIEIPYGRSESDFWEMFDILTNRIKIKDREVIVDVTHCFRAIPLFVAIYIRFIKHLEPTAKFSHIFYGSYEKGQPVNPVVDLAPILELLDWIDATVSFMKHGELEELSMKVKKANDMVWKNEDIKEKPKNLGEFSKRLKRLSDLSRLTYIPLLPETSKEMSELLNREAFKGEIIRYAKPFSLLFDSLAKYIIRFAKPSIWESHLEAAK